ncbi:Hypothetical protein, putative [Bodo saltans]|uniref:Ribosomal RNA methyltransferase FtsJ domain-containing protein n=1 Tax=Bodo saltans TaxID=75058 RepID=A0A0S4JAG9_BODSA|nr:Hypothetical protein, putative [Bodo saltans]|eukprot:CUG87116.1 Hypothetical protein, putative [Bodo saltans]
MDDKSSAAAYHAELTSSSAAYRTYATTRQDLWKDPRFQQAQARLGRSGDYAAHYVQHLLPKLREHFGNNTEPKAAPLRFLDMGCAPGGLCETLLHRSGALQWSGVGVTLHEQDGGLPMDVGAIPDRFDIRYADVTHRDAFVHACVKDDEVGTFDFVNCGIVLDQTVRRKRSGGNTATQQPSDEDASSASTTPMISFGEQLYTQLLVAARALKSDGSGAVMMALKTDFPSLPEMIPTLATLIQHRSSHTKEESNDGYSPQEPSNTLPGSHTSVRVIPTMYTMTCGKKQFYTVVFGAHATAQLAEDVRRIWNLGTARYLAMKRTAIAAKRARDDNTVEGASVSSASKQKLVSVQNLVVSTLASSSGDGSVDAVVVESNGYVAHDAVSSVYATVTGKDLDAFFGMVSAALQQQASGQRLGR